MKNNIYIVDLESVPTRYTCEWKDHVPKLLRDAGFNVQVISGPTDIPAATSPGAFLNFGGTNIYKAAQVMEMGRLFTANKIKAGDHFLFTDAWNPGIINLKYMSELLGIPIKIHALWHAGSYDPADFLGRLIGDAKWVRNAERSFFQAVDYNYFATHFHIDMFQEILLGIFDGVEISHGYLRLEKIIRTGWPMEYIEDTLAPYKNMEKRNLILFPHRVAPEKQVDIFRDLAKSLPQYEFIVCQDKQLTKQEYHSLLGQAKIVFSASLQETLGIGCYEGAIVGAIPMVPDRLSYVEMYFKDFRYPSEWTENWKFYELNKSQIMNEISWSMINYHEILPLLEHQTDLLTKRFFNADKMVRNFSTALSDDK